MKKVVLVLCVILLPLIYIDLVIRQPWIEERPYKIDIVHEQVIDDISANDQDEIIETTTINTQVDKGNVSDNTEVSDATQQRINNFLSNYTEILNNEDVGRISEFESMFYNYEVLSDLSDDIRVLLDKKIHVVSIEDFEVVNYKLHSIDSIDGDFYSVTLEFEGKYNDEQRSIMTMPAIISVKDKVSFVEDFIIEDRINLLDNGGQVNALFLYNSMMLVIEERFDAVNGIRRKPQGRLNINISNPTELSYSFSDKDSKLVIELSNGKVIEESLKGTLITAVEGNLRANIYIENFDQLELSYPVKFIYMNNVVTQDDVMTSQLFYGSDYDSFSSKQNEMLDSLK